MKKNRTWTDTPIKYCGPSPDGIEGIGNPINIISESIGSNGITIIRWGNYYCRLNNEFIDDNISPMDSDYYFRI